MFTQGVDPELDFTHLPKLREIYERCTSMKIDPRQPYIGELVFTAFSGSHQDAINKGMQYMRDSGTEMWEIPYLPIDPADVGREYEPIIRINSQSGKGGAAFVMSNNFGYDLPKRMHPEFSKLVQAKCEALGRELVPKELFDVFNENYLEHAQKYALTSRKIYEESENGQDYVHFKGKMTIDGSAEVKLNAIGNGPVDAFFNAIKSVGLDKYEFISYSQHAISQGSDSKAVSYIELKKPNGKHIFGIGIDSNVNVASVLGVLNAINRAETEA
jgi:2-isopropylmalate synthase